MYDIERSQLFVLLIKRRTEDVNFSKTTMHSWQITPFIAKKFGNFIPCAGVKYSDSRSKVKEFDDNNVVKSRAKDIFGGFIGLDYKIGKNFRLNCEGRFVEEYVISAEIASRF